MFENKENSLLYKYECRNNGNKEESLPVTNNNNNSNNKNFLHLN